MRPGHTELCRSRRDGCGTETGRLAVSEVTSADVLEILAPIWHVKAVTARRVCQRIRAVREWAVAMEFRTDNPCDRVGPVLGPQDAVAPRYRNPRPSRTLGEEAGRLIFTRGGAGACGPEQRRGGLPANRPVRAPTPVDGRLGGLLGQRRELRIQGHSRPVVCLAMPQG